MVLLLLPRYQSHPVMGLVVLELVEDLGKDAAAMGMTAVELLSVVWLGKS